MMRLPESAAAAVAELITGVLLENPRRVGKPLGFELDGRFGARRGAYRIIYEIQDAEHVVLVERIDHRADVYRPS
jgi:mRNA interferase RelE/StbE